jgi:GR25 family glycosyltransferase involved in LPS biosynthesis
MKERMGWDFFDKFYCISVSEREDRRATAKKQFALLGLSHKVEFVLVDKHATDPEQGIYESHMLCMKNGIRAGAETFVIFEDDVIFDRFQPETLDRCTAFLSSAPDWKMCHFGCMVKRSRKTGNPSVRKIRYRSLTHAYAVHRPFAETLSSNPWKGIPYDDFLQTFRDDVYILYPTFAFQSDSPSDNDSWMALEALRKLLGGLERLQKMNEFYHRYRAPVIALHVLAALLLLRWIF